MCDKVGYGRKYQTIDQEQKAEHGVYRSNVNSMPVAARLPILQNPEAPKASPFKVRIPFGSSNTR